MLGRRNKRLDQFLETESLEYRDAIRQHRKDRDDKERQIDKDLFAERREGSNWLENRQMRVAELALDYERTLIATRIEIRKRLGLEYPALLSDVQLSQLQEVMLQSLRVGRQARRDDYERRARAAGVPSHQSEHREAAKYGALEELVRSEVRKLVLARSLGRIAKKPSFLMAMFKAWAEAEPLIKFVTTAMALAGAAIGLYLKLA